MVGSIFSIFKTKCTFFFFAETVAIIFQESGLVYNDSLFGKFGFPLGNLHKVAGNSLAILLSTLAALPHTLRLCNLSSSTLSMLCLSLLKFAIDTGPLVICFKFSIIFLCSEYD